MYAVALGVIFLLMKYLEVSPVAAWSWWVVLAPFGIASAWWAWADSSGWTKNKAMQRDENRRQARIDKNREDIGTLNSKKRR